MPIGSIVVITTNRMQSTYGTGVGEVVDFREGDNNNPPMWKINTYPEAPYSYWFKKDEFRTATENDMEIKLRELLAY